ncbi:MAG: antibiotic biosynthesis monooxygenase family protein [Candidatus Velthaea sp.]
MIALLPEDEHIVLINRFTGHPDRSEELLALLVHATENTMRHQPGFISAKLHKSLDGSRIANYVQWRSLAALEAMQANQEAYEHMQQAAAIADSFDPLLYSLRHASPLMSAPGQPANSKRSRSMSGDVCTFERSIPRLPGPSVC